jgi:chromosome segregation ATPase
MQKNRGRLVLLVLAIITLGSLWRTATVERDRRQLSTAYQQAQQAVSELDATRAQLQSELAAAQQAATAKTEEIAALQEELQQVQAKLEDTAGELAALQREHEQLRAENISLEDQVAAINAEKQQLEARLSDLRELRVAIRDVKRKMAEERWAAWRARVEAFKRTDQERLAAGNRGYVVRDGSTTLGQAARLRVQVLQPQAQ